MGLGELLIKVATSTEEGHACLPALRLCTVPSNSAAELLCGRTHVARH